MKIKYKYTKDDSKLLFTWSNFECCISITEDENIDLNDLYDYIIENIEDVQLENNTHPDDEVDTVAYKASTSIIEAINEEMNKIKEQMKNMSLS